MIEMFKPGAKVKKSGIYTVLHEDAHDASHDVTCVSDKVFPPCVHCGEQVRFRLRYAARSIATHEHFKVD